MSRLPCPANATEVAILVKCLPDIQQAADLIEQYARTVQSGARLDAALHARAGIEAPLSRPKPIPFEAIGRTPMRRNSNDDKRRSIPDQASARAACDAGYLSTAEYLRLAEKYGWSTEMDDQESTRA